MRYALTTTLNALSEKALTVSVKYGCLLLLVQNEEHLLQTLALVTTTDDMTNIIVPDEGTELSESM